MRITIIFALITFFIYGCKSYVQVFETKSTNVIIEDGLYVYENDTVKITYNFWREKGLMSFSIYNKLNVPLYVDWKKSSYIDNSVKLNYWIDEEIKKTLEYYGGYYYDGPVLIPGYAVSETAGASISSIIRVERITFIPPESKYSRSQFYILPITYFHMGDNTSSIVVSRNDKPKKKTTVFEKEYEKKDSPLIFRNFLTLSYDEDFENEFYINSYFYLSKVLEMDKRHFEQYRYDRDIDLGQVKQKDRSGNWINLNPFKKGSSFYIRISTEKSIEWEK